MLMNVEEAVEKYGVSVGTDSEGFLIDPSGKPVSSIGKIGGSKWQPRRTEHGAVQEDNVLVEFNTHPAKSGDEFVNNVRLVLCDLDEIIKPLDLSVDFCATKVFSPEELDHPMARLAGCDPDFDPYELSVNEPPDYESLPIRSAGGHVHVAWNRNHNDDMEVPEFCKYLDLFLGVPSILLDPDKERRALYGKAGCHRPKMLEIGDPYDGVEYRSLSSFWLKSDEYIKWIFENTVNALDLFKTSPFESVEKLGAREIINSSNKKEAESLIRNFNIPLPVGA
jgi:hypothetical protein